MADSSYFRERRKGTRPPTLQRVLSLHYRADGGTYSGGSTCGSGSPFLLRIARCIATENLQRRSAFLIPNLAAGDFLSLRGENQSASRDPAPPTSHKLQIAFNASLGRPDRRNTGATFAPLARPPSGAICWKIESYRAFSVALTTHAYSRTRRVIEKPLAAPKLAAAEGAGAAGAAGAGPAHDGERDCAAPAEPTPNRPSKTALPAPPPPPAPRRFGSDSGSAAPRDCVDQGSVPPGGGCDHGSAGVGVDAAAASFACAAAGDAAAHGSIGGTATGAPPAWTLGLGDASVAAGARPPPGMASKRSISCATSVERIASSASRLLGSSFLNLAKSRHACEM